MKYMILVNYEATPANTYFFQHFDSTQSWLEGKGGYLTRCEGLSRVPTYVADNWAYNTKAAATRAYNARKRAAEAEEKRGAWKVFVSICEC